MLRSAVFLDRDGTINEDPGYLNDPDQIILLPGAGEGLFLLAQKGYFLVVVTNQSGVARGLVKEEMLPLIHRRLNQELSRFGAKIDHFSICVHHPDENCECRKPKSKLLMDAAEKFGIDLANSYFVGDKGSDLAAGRAAGCKGVALVRTGYGAEMEKKLKSGDANFVGSTLKEVAVWILAKENASS